MAPHANFGAILQVDVELSLGTGTTKFILLISATFGLPANAPRIGRGLPVRMLTYKVVTRKACEEACGGR